MSQRLATASENPSQDRQGVENRAYQRLPCELHGFCTPASDLGSEEARWAIIARDISPGGVRLVLPRRFQPGAGLAIELQPRGEEQTSTFLGRVIYVRPEPGGFWTHGCQFISPLSQEELKHLIGVDLSEDFFPEDQPHANVGSPKSAVAHSTFDVRHSTLPVHFQLLGSQGTLLDCRIKRLRVGASWPLASGKTITIRGTDSSKTPWALPVQVVDCTQQGDAWQLRCRLLRAPSPAALLQALTIQ
jgi:hypothetical protein